MLRHGARSFDYSADVLGLQLTVPSTLLHDAPGQDPALPARLSPQRVV